MDDCINWQGALSHGYGWMTIHGKQVRAHRFYYEKYVGPIPDGMEVCHHCDNPRCINTNHLFVGTHQDNMRDARLKGRFKSGAGELNHRAKLSQEQVDLIRARATLGENQRWLAVEYGVGKIQINRIVTNKAWDGGDPYLPS